jgi:hypothetical protein
MAEKADLLRNQLSKAPFWALLQFGFKIQKRVA